MSFNLSRQGSSSPALFSPLLWAAVGLQPKNLNISRQVFFPEPSAPFSPRPACSKEASDRQQAGASSRGYVDARINDVQAAKRRRSPQGKVITCGNSCDVLAPLQGVVPAAAFIPDYDALRKFTTQPRTGTRRPTQQLRSIALDLGLETARTLRLGTVPSLSVLSGHKVASLASEPQSHPGGASPLSCNMELEPCSLLSEEELCCSSGKGILTSLCMPTSHSGTSSQGVFGIPSPLIHSESSKLQAQGMMTVQQAEANDGTADWGLCSPVSEEGSVECQE